MNKFHVVALAIVILDCGQARAQDWWDQGTTPIDAPCTKDGFTLFPGFDDPWIFNVHCITYNGTVGCFDGICKCNQFEDAYFSLVLDRCVGKVGAICSAEHDSFFPAKLCTPNADCVPLLEAGRPIGICECLYGFKQNDTGHCVRDEEIGDGDVSTPRTTTTTEVPPKENLTIPWDLIITERYAGFGEECHPDAILNRTVCHSYGNTVSCRDNKCQCSRVNATFDLDQNQCVGLAGSFCLALEWPWLWAPCVTGADCVLIKGTCECLYGYLETENGTCERDELISNPSTAKPRPTPSEIPSTPTTPLPPGDVCPPEGFDKVEHPSECGLYYVCVNGQAYEEACADSLHFNPETKECDFPENVGCTKPLPNCPPEGVSFHPYPGNCTLYYICAEGTPLLQHCSPGLCFDPVELKCRPNDNLPDFETSQHLPLNFDDWIDGFSEIHKKTMLS